MVPEPMNRVARLALFLLPLTAAFPQATVQITGTVTDPAGAAIPTAEVKAVETETGFQRVASSGPDGRYILANLPVGPYQIEATATGFQSYQQRGVILQANTNPTVNIVMTLGSIQQTVMVTANAVMTETQQTSISQVITQRNILDLPLNGRQATELVLLSGAAVIPPNNGIISSKNAPGSQVISVAGGQSNGTYYMVDGGDHSDPFGAINLPFPFPDALQEFSVQTNTLSSNYGVRAGAVVNTVTKSGTNEFHGSAFEFLRTGAANARNYFASDRDHLQRNQFGAVIGGPVVHNKLLFFGGYQGTRVTTAPPTTRSFVPNSAMLAGDFSTRMSAACGTVRTLLDPTTGRPFPGSQIPVSRYVPQALNFLKYVPSSEDRCGQILYGIPDNSTDHQAIGRVDYLRREQHTLFGRYFFSDNANPAVFDGKNLLQTTRPGVLVRVQSSTFGDTYSLSARTINSFRFTWNRGWLTRGAAPNVITPAQIGITKIAESPGNFPALTVNSGFSTFCGTCSKAYVHNWTMHFANDISVQRDRHQFSLGINVLRYRSDYVTTTQQNAAFTFNGQFTNESLADFLLGAPSLFQQGNRTQTNQTQNIWGVYADDKYRVSKHLTLNYGIRWEPFLPVYDIDNRRTHFDMDAFRRGDRTAQFENAPAGFIFPGDPGMPRAGTYSKWLQFSPRAGLVWDVVGNGRLTVRSSYGLLYDQPDIQYPNRFGFGSPWASIIRVDNPRGGFADPYSDYPGGNPFPLPSPPPKNVVFPLGAEFINLPLHIKMPYQQQWNLSVQRQMGADWLLSATYLGNKSTHRWVNQQLNYGVYIPGQSTTGNTQARRVLTLIRPADGAKVSSLVHADDGANAHYNGLLLSVNHRLSNNFTLLGNYTWSHCISESDFNSEMTGGYQNPFSRAAERANCEADRRQIFNSSVVVMSPRFSAPMPRRILGNWQTSVIVRRISGQWISPNAGRDNAFTGLGNRPDRVGNLSLANPSIQQWFNRAAFVANRDGTIGNSARNIISGPANLTADAALMRRFTIREGKQFELRVEAFNFINHARFGNPNTNIRDANYGQILSAGEPRLMQFAGKFYF